MSAERKRVANINSLNLGDHAVLFYRKNREILNSVFTFIKRALVNNQKCIYIDERSQHDKILEEFRNSDFELSQYLKNDQLIMMTKKEIYGSPENFNADQMIKLLKEETDSALADGFKGLRITGELKGVINFNGGKEEIIKYEWKLHEEIFEEKPVIALCRYNLNKFDNEVIRAAIELHDYIVWNNKLHENPYYIDPAGYRDNKVEEYEIKSWLKNIDKYQLKENYYKNKIEEKNKELAAYNQQLKAYNEELSAVNTELEESFAEVERLNKRFEKMISLISDIDNINTISESEFLSKILKDAVEIIPEADWGCCYTFGQKYINYLDCIGHDIEKLKKKNIRKEAFLSKEKNIEIVSSKDIKKRNKKNMSSRQFKNMKAETLNKIKEVMYFDLEINGIKKAGISLDIKKESDQSFSQNSKQLFKAFYNLISSFYKLKEYNLLQNNFTKELVSSTVKMLEMYDLYTRGHSENVADLSVKIAEKMELAQKRIDNIYWAGLVHDIGKMLIPLEILNKDGKLTDSEYKVIKEHPVLGSNALGSSKALKHIAKFVRYHHEHWDGNGYPEGLKGKEIPLESRILSAADAWDAMRSKRTYRKPLTFNHALAELKDNRGSQFAPGVVDALLNILKKK